MSDELKPCPFCGSEATIERKGTARASMQIACTNCGARMESGDVHGLTKPEAWAWNRRTDTDLKARMEAVENAWFMFAKAIDGTDTEEQMTEGQRVRYSRLSDAIAQLRALLAPVPAAVAVNESRLPVIAGRMLSGTNADFERSCLVHIERLQNGLGPYDSAMMATFCEAVRMVREYSDAMQGKTAPERTTSAAAWCRVVRLVNEPEPPEVKAELDAKEIDACRNLECDYFAARMSSALRAHCSVCTNKGSMKT